MSSVPTAVPVVIINSLTASYFGVGDELAAAWLGAVDLCGRELVCHPVGVAALLVVGDGVAYVLNDLALCRFCELRYREFHAKPVVAGCLIVTISLPSVSGVQQCQENNGNAYRYFQQRVPVFPCSLFGHHYPSVMLFSTCRSSGQPCMYRLSLC